MILESVDVVNDISKEDFQKNYFKKHKPLLIKNFASRWDAFDKWNFDFIREKAGEQEVPLYDNKPADANKSSDAPGIKRASPCSMKISKPLACFRAGNFS